MIDEVSLDYETKSDIDLKKNSVYAYVASPVFQILMVAYKFNDEPVQFCDLTKEVMPYRLVTALRSPLTKKKAYNAQFERLCTNKHLGINSPVESWFCTLVHTAYLGLPLSLDYAARVLKLDELKDSAGTALINYFCKPCKPTEANGFRTWNLPEHAPDKWQAFCDYCVQDVVTEYALAKKLSIFPIPATERALYCLDQKINDIGVKVNVTMIKNAIRIDGEFKDLLRKEAIQITRLENPNSIKQLTSWLEEHLVTIDEDGNEQDVKIADLKAESVKTLIKEIPEGTVKRMLEIRQQSARTSVKKYLAMLKSICPDGRVKGLLQFYGANRTGRWAGRVIQVHNLPRIRMEVFTKEKHGFNYDDLDEARNTVLEGDGEWLKLIYGNVADVLAQLIRPTIEAETGHHFKIADYKAIEARVIAYLANEEWRLEVFRNNGDIYLASAERMFKLPLGSLDKKSPLRQQGKVAELALGYQGGENAITVMDTDNKIPDKDKPGIKKAWREQSKNIVKFWYDVQDAAIEAVLTGQKINLHHGIAFHTKNNILFISLPSGRQLAYMRPKLHEHPMVYVKFIEDHGLYKKGQKTMMSEINTKDIFLAKRIEITSEVFIKHTLSYEFINQKINKWSRIPTYGGKLVENIVQAFARDVLAYALLQLDKAGYKIVMHVHDEIVAECKDGDRSQSCEEMGAIMGADIPWAKGLPIGADAYESKYYRKD